MPYLSFSTTILLKIEQLGNNGILRFIVLGIMISESEDGDVYNKLCMYFFTKFTKKERNQKVN